MTRLHLAALIVISIGLACQQALVPTTTEETGVAASDTPPSQDSPWVDSVVAAVDEPSQSIEPAAVFAPPASIETPADSDQDDLIALLQGQDSDRDGRSDYDEVISGNDPTDPTDGPDVDGDGIENGADPDIDGDGIANGDDADADGDGVSDSMDDDDDGDGEPDATDDDDNADGEDDCGCDNGSCEPISGSCICEEGWHGTHCDQPDCNDVQHCNNGICIGPNICQCKEGWEDASESRPCATFHCGQRNDCSFHGTCSGPNVCDCQPDWRGSPDCSRQTCVVSPSVCDDGDECTMDECDASLGCTHEAVICSLFEVCVRGDCVFPCNTIGDCDPGQACRAGGCFDDCEEDIDCIDGDGCTIDECDPATGCSNEPIVCQLTEACVRGRCVDECEESSDCDSGQACAEGGCHTECQIDSDCAVDEHCDEDGACLPPQEGEDTSSQP